MYLNQLSHDTALEVINSDECVFEFFDELFKNRSTCGDLIGPTISVLVSCFVIARDRGFCVSGAKEPLSGFLLMSQNRIIFEFVKSINFDPVEAGLLISSIIKAVGIAKASGCTWHPVAQSGPNPLPVSVVSMVDRVTTTEVVRDSNGLIKGSKQTELDVKCAV